ncbi:hypothetical protein ES319_A12G070400v1 [Gossypium barbadense]|uniref:AB hydrolase-1 domain-containing protein n=1 Tax=Gossypium barbadense TaxID=3634 RepID=A0A5J5TBE0_GOSBA|nr:hypothetical protein ES319_A12G070400v1 [Gossypium barbadense]
MAEAENKNHFVLVHGICNSAWNWFKLKPQPESASCRVTLLDLAASGINMKAIHDAIVVGHGLGGPNLALTMDLFPHKISVGVFLLAFMPNTILQPSYLVDKYFEIVTIGSPEETFTITTMGPNFLKSRLYQVSRVKNLELVKTLVRPGSLFHQDLSKEKTLSDEGYGSVTRVFFFCDKDQAINIKLKRWMINNNPLKAVLEIKGAEHMPMFSKTKQLCNVLMREKEFEIEGLKRRKREKRNQRN